MTVQDLIDSLSDFDPDAEVKLMSQQSWPFENEIHGITDRADLERSGKESDDEFDPDAKEKDDSDDEAPADVFIVEGNQLKYGDKNAWTVCG